MATSPKKYSEFQILLCIYQRLAYNHFFQETIALQFPKTG